MIAMTRNIPFRLVLVLFVIFVSEALSDKTLLLLFGNNLLYFGYIVCFGVIVNIAPSKREMRLFIIIN